MSRGMEDGDALVVRHGRIAIRVSAMGGDLVFLVGGGTAHVGACAMASAGEAGRPPHAAVHALPGHREGELAAELAELAAASLGRTSAVVAGIHLDRPDRADIEAAVEEARHAMRRCIELLLLRCGHDAPAGTSRATRGR